MLVNTNQLKIRLAMISGAALFVAIALLFAPGLSSASMPVSEPVPDTLLAPAHTLSLLPGDAAIEPAAMDQDNAQIAPGGDGYLVVWEDTRTNYLGITGPSSPGIGESSGQTLKDIFAVRLDVNGQLLDPTPIILTQATYDQTVPQVAWNGQNWLVVWNTQRVADYTTTKDVVGVRVSPQGTVLDATPIIINDNPYIDELWPTVASDGTNWLVVWMDEGSYYELDGARVAPNGSVLDTGGVPIHTPQFPDAPYNVSATFAGDEYMLVWSGDNAIKGLRLTPNLQRIGSVFSITAQGGQNFPELASNGTDFLVAWQAGYDVYGSRISHSGQVMDHSGINISNSNTGYPYPDVGWDGTQWFVTWVPYTNNVYAARVSTGGQLLDPNGVLVASGSATVSAIAGRYGGGAYAVWTDYGATGLSRYDTYKAFISAGGVAGTPAPASMGAPSQRQPDFAPNGNGYMVAFVSEVSGDMRIKTQRLDAGGNAMDPEPVLVTSGSPNSMGNPSVAWNGSLYLVVWENNSFVYGRRVGADGIPIDPAPISIMAGNTPDVEALGDTFLVAATYSPSYQYRFTRSVRVRGSDGAVLGSPTTLGTSYARYPDVSILGSRWLVAWQSNDGHDSPNSTVFASFVNQDGSYVGQFLVGYYRSKTPDVASKGDQALIVFFNNGGNGGEIRARRILPDGTLLDGDAGISVTSAPDQQFLPAVAWNGSEYVVGYEDYRNVSYMDSPVSDIYATRVDANGTVLDPNGFVIASRSVPEAQVAVSSLPDTGGYLMAFNDFRTDASLAAYRIEIRTYLASVTPTPIPTNTPMPPTNTLTPTPTSTPTLTPTPTSTPCGFSLLMTEGFESGTLGGFSSSGSPGWAPSLFAHTGSYAAFVSDVEVIADQRLTSVNPVVIPAGATQATLSFWHWFEFEPGNFDGGVLEISTDGGANWSDAGPNLTSGGYNGIISSDYGNPLAGRQAWVDMFQSPDFAPVTVNMLPYAGQVVLFRFREGTDESTGWIGWFIDDVLVTIAVPCQSQTALQGHVTWQGRPAQPHIWQQLPITLTLKLGTNEHSYNGITDPNGVFTTNIDSLASGTYTWRAKNPKYLANSGTVVLSGAPITNVEMGLLRAGDANNDNSIGILDFNIMKPTFGRAIGDPGYDDRADFSGDQTVDITDFSLLKANFNQSGAPPISPGGR